MGGMELLRRTLGMALFGLLTTGVQAQLILNGSLTPADCVQNILLGNGIVATNITFNGQPGTQLNPQIGGFNGTLCNIGMAGGVILATGSINNATGPNNSGSASEGGGTNLGDPDVLAVSQITNPNIMDVNDAAILEFDFVPQGDSLSFDFIFASDEYLEFVNSVNDAFGFFISGPGISGPFTNNAANIALIPGTSRPVTIDDVNNVVNSQYYVVNGDGSNAPYNMTGYYVQYDGFTVTLTARAQVICGETYHIKIAVADASDTVWDSAVFLAAGSFSSNGVELSSQIDFGGQDSTLYEGCGVATLVLSRPDGVNSTESVQFITQGVAVEGADYEPLADVFTFLPGEDTILIGVHALADNLVEGTELVEILAIVNGGCGPDTTLLQFYIADAPPILLEMTDDITLPCNDSVFVGGTASGGFGALNLTWNTGIPNGTAGAWVIPDVTTTYILTVTDDCGVNTAVGQVTVTVPQPPPLVVQALPDTVVNCPESPVPLQAQASGGTPPYAYQWSNGLGNGLSVNVAPPVTRSWTATVTDACGEVTSDAVTVTVAYDSVRVTVSPDTAVCKGDTANLRAYPAFGWGGYDLVWSDEATGALHDVVPANSGPWMVTVTDGCGISDSATVHVDLHIPSADFTHETFEYVVGYPIQFLDLSIGAVQWDWVFDLDGSTATDQYPTFTYQEPGNYTVTLLITDPIGCQDSTFRLLIIDPQAEFFLPNAFTPDGDGLNETFGPEGVGILEYELLIFNRWGQLVFSATDPRQRWDGTYNGTPVENGVYAVKCRWRDARNNKRDHFGHVTVLR